jgi:hypothetical protein
MLPRNRNISESAAKANWRFGRRFADSLLIRPAVIGWYEAGFDVRYFFLTCDFFPHKMSSNPGGSMHASSFDPLTGAAAGRPIIDMALGGFCSASTHNAGSDAQGGRLQTCPGRIVIFFKNYSKYLKSI